jgi:hypothetical protein
MLGIDPEFGASVLRLWVAAGSAILLILFCALALFQPQLRVASSPARRTGFVLAGAVLGGVIASAFLDRGLWGSGNADRHAFEIRAQQLNALALAPGSPLACLDALAGETVETACEKALFVSPASVAAASSYVAAQLTLLSSVATYAQRRGADIEEVLAPLRRSLETDRFGFVAHVLAVRDSCTGQSCKTLALFRDANRVRANLNAATIDRYLERYAALWSAGSDGPVAEGAQAQPAATASTNGQGARKVVNIDFPSAASIPAVSIMNPEPSGPVLPGVAAAAAANPNPLAAGSPSPRHARKQTASPAAATPVAGQSATSTAVEPIWPEPVPTPPAGLAPQAASAPAVAAPVQLTPPLPNASAGTSARTQ